MFECDIISYWSGWFSSAGLMASFSFALGIPVIIGIVVDQEEYASDTLLPLFSVFALWLHNSAIQQRKPY